MCAFLLLRCPLGLFLRLNLLLLLLPAALFGVSHLGSVRVQKYNLRGWIAAHVWVPRGVYVCTLRSESRGGEKERGLFRIGTHARVQSHILPLLYHFGKVRHYYTYSAGACYVPPSVPHCDSGPAWSLAIPMEPVVYYSDGGRMHCFAKSTTCSRAAHITYIRAHCEFPSFIRA